MQAMAWWVFISKKENRFVADEIPDYIIPYGLSATKSSKAAVREAIVGYVIEPISHTGVLGSKAKRYYYFPHKSYLEFLVANYFQTHELSQNDLSHINREMLDFIEEGPRAGVDN